MTKDELVRQVARWAKKAGASSDRATNYADRAGKAFDGLLALSGVFADSFNKNHPHGVTVSPECVVRPVAAYNRSLMQFKLDHGISIEDRIDTHLCAGLWFCALVQEPVFGCDDEAAERWDTATQQQLDAYWQLIGHFAFYFSFRILRGHYSKFEEVYLLNILKPIRKFMIDHVDAGSASPAAAVGIFLAISVFDEDCAIPPVLS